MKTLLSSYRSITFVGLVALSLLLLANFFRPRESVQASVAQATLAGTPSIADLVAQGRYFPHALVWVGPTPPREDESALLLSVLEVWRESGGTSGRQELEEFLEAMPDSPWVPSLHGALGDHLQSRGQTTPALAHWEAAWEASKGFETGAGKRVGDYALARWTRLLVLLGRSDELNQVYREHGSRILDRGPLTQMWLRTYEKHVRMHKYPDDSYKCGIYALDQIGQAFGFNYSRAALLRTPGKSEGFSLLELQGISEIYALGLVPAARTGRAGELVVPSIVHWRQNHYSTIIDEQNGLYRISDPGAMGPQLLTAEEINAEATGYFLIPADRLGGAFSRLTPAEANQVFGRASTCPPEDWEDITCRVSASGDNPNYNIWTRTMPARGGGGSHTCPNQCPPGNSPVFGPPSNPFQTQANGGCATGCLPMAGGSAPDGMPRFRVSEPQLNLWIEDIPLTHLPSKGPPVTFQLNFKQREEEFFVSGVGYNWRCNLFSRTTLAVGGGGYPLWAWLYLPEGGRLFYEFPASSLVSDFNYKNNTYLETVLDEWDAVALCILHFADGSSYEYAPRPYDLLLTAIVDPQGNRITLNYDDYEVYPEWNWSMYLLVSITDADGDDTTFDWTVLPGADYLPVITNIVAPGSRSVSLNYNSDGHLTNIVDSAGISSSMAYDAVTGWVTSLTTPYGTTSFEYLDFDIISLYDRAVLVTQPDNGKHIYLLVDDAGTNMPSQFLSGQLPTNTPFATGGYPYGTLETENRQERNTFYWNPQQAASLSTTNLADFSWNEFKRGRIRHWLWKFEWSANHVDTLSHEQAPSPDGTAEGHITWYDYDGKDHDSPELRGTQVLPAVIARVMPDSSTSYTWYQRNDWGAVTTEIDFWHDGGARYRTNQFTYAANGIDLLEHRFNPAGANELIAGFAYSGSHPHLPVRMTNALNEVTHFTYDNLNRLTSTTTPSSLLITNIYGGDGYLQTVRESFVGGASLRTNTYTWLHGNLRTHTDERGLTITNSWDGLNRLTRVDYPDATYIYHGYTNAAGMILDRTYTRDRLGNETRWLYDGLRRPLQMTDPRGMITTYDHCPCGSIATVAKDSGGPLEEITSFWYDNQGRLTDRDNPDGTVNSFSYDLIGRLIVTTDGAGSTTNVYDNLSRLIAVSNHFGRVTAHTYDDEDNIITQTDANGVTITNYHDGLHRLTSRVYPGSASENWAYTAGVRPATGYTNQLGHVWLYTFDPAGRKTNEVAVGMYTNKFTYSPASDLLTLTDGKNQMTKWNYDLHGRVTNKVDQASVEILRYQYDANSRLTNRWSKAMGNTAYAYDANGNLTLVDYPAGTTDITFAYDSLNRATNMVDAVGTTTYSYHPGGRLWTEDGPWSNDTVTNLFNNAGLRSSLALQQPAGLWTNSFAYDAARRLTNVTSPPGSFGYTLGGAGPASSLIKRIALPNSSYITNTYDSMARLTGTFLKNSTHTTLNSHEYAYNAGNQRTQQAFGAGSTYNYTYDPIGQLVFADSATSSEDRGYFYDAAWNLNRRTNNATTSTFTVDNKNQLTGMFFYDEIQYDDNGNMIHRYADWQLFWSYEYDAENQLVAVEYAYYYSPEWRTEFVYDGRGRLRKATEYTWDYEEDEWLFESETRYIYDGMRVIQERDGSNNPLVAYTRGTDLSGSMEGAGGIGGLLARSHSYTTGGGGLWLARNFYHADGNGNITAMINISQASVASYRYDPFGNTISKSGTLADANTHRFSSKPIHVKSGLYYYGYRFYDPNAQRWLNRDPLGESAGFNLYGFVGNSPVTHVDTDGRLAWFVVGAVAVYFLSEAYLNAPGPADRNYKGLTMDNALGLAAGTLLCAKFFSPLLPSLPKEGCELIKESLFDCLYKCTYSDGSVQTFYTPKPPGGCPDDPSKLGPNTFLDGFWDGDYLPPGWQNWDLLP